MKTKSDLRQTFRRALSEEADVERRDRSTRMLNLRLVEFLNSQTASRSLWASFQPTGFEADIRPAMKSLSEIRWAFPRVEGESMRFFRVDDEASFSLNQWGILEPDASHSTAVDSRELAGLLVPGLGFDLKCNRLGRGGGYYDRALADITTLNPNAIKIGVALDLQVSKETFPAEEFDIPMDWVVTETRSIQCERITS